MVSYKQKKCTYIRISNMTVAIQIPHPSLYFFYSRKEWSGHLRDKKHAYSLCHIIQKHTNHRSPNKACKVTVPFPLYRHEQKLRYEPGKNLCRGHTMKDVDNCVAGTAILRSRERLHDLLSGGHAFRVTGFVFHRHAL